MFVLYVQVCKLTSAVCSTALYYFLLTPADNRIDPSCLLLNWVSSSYVTTKTGSAQSQVTENHAAYSVRRTWPDPDLSHLRRTKRNIKFPVLSWTNRQNEHKERLFCNHDYSTPVRHDFVYITSVLHLHLSLSDDVTVRLLQTAISIRAEIARTRRFGARILRVYANDAIGTSQQNGSG